MTRVAPPAPARKQRKGLSMTGLAHASEQHAKALDAIIDGLIPAVREQARSNDVCPLCLFQNLASTLLLNVGLHFLHEGQQENWLAGIDDIVAAIRAAYTAPGDLH